MSFLARYFSSLRRRPTSSSSPRRLWLSCLVTFRCSVRWLIRLVSSATWTSGEPVSPSLVAYSTRISFLAAVSSGTLLLRIGANGFSGLIPLGRGSHRRVQPPSPRPSWRGSFSDYHERRGGRPRQSAARHRASSDVAATGIQ